MPPGSARLRCAQTMEAHALLPHADQATPASGTGGLRWGPSRPHGRRQGRTEHASVCGR